MVILVAMYKSVIIWCFNENNCDVKYSKVPKRGGAIIIGVSYLEEIRYAVAGTRFPAGGVDLVDGGVDCRSGYVSKIFVCQNERIWTLRGQGACVGHSP